MYGVIFKVDASAGTTKLNWLVPIILNVCVANNEVMHVEYQSVSKKC